MHTSALQDIASRCRSQLVVIASHYAAEVQRLPGYESAAVSEEELYLTAQQVLDLLMQMLAGNEVRGQLRGVSERVGRRRAQQGLALDSLLRAVRMDFRFLWKVLREEARDEQLLALSEDVATVWEAVELHTSHIQAAYIDELVAMNRQLEIERASLFRRLLLGETRDAAQLAHLASALRLRVDAPYVVVVAAAQYADAFRRWTRAHACNNELLAIDGTQFLMLDTGLRGAPSLADLSTAPAGISPVLNGLSEVGAGWNTARELSNAVDSPNKAATMQSHWPTLARRGLGNSWSIMRRSLTNKLDALPTGKRAVILESVRVFMANGSVGETSAALFIHRNTLLKRLQRFQELTGLDATVPNDAALISLVIEERLQSPRSGPATAHS
jgi:hypothetical protein